MSPCRLAVTLLANPLEHGGNTITEVIDPRSEPDGVVVYTLPARAPANTLVAEARLPLEEWLRAFPEGATAAFFVSARQPVVWVRTFSARQAAAAGLANAPGTAFKIKFGLGR